MTSQLIWADWEGQAVVMNDWHAWVLADGRWHEVDRAEAGHKAAVISRQLCAQMFGPLPQLPKAAFRRHLLLNAVAEVMWWSCRHFGWPFAV